MQQMQALYNKLKYQQQAGTLEIAADQGAEDILMQAGSQQQPQHRISTQRLDGQSQHHHQHQPRVHGGSNGSGGSGERRQQRTHSWPQGDQQAYSHQNAGMMYQHGPSYRPGVDTSRKFRTCPQAQPH